jgi:hypothetical protein
VKIQNPVDARIWAMLKISLPSIVLIHHSIGQKLQDVVLVTRSIGGGGGGGSSWLTSGLFEAECLAGIGFGLEKARQSPTAL